MASCQWDFTGAGFAFSFNIELKIVNYFKTFSRYVVLSESLTLNAKTYAAM